MTRKALTAASVLMALSAGAWAGTEGIGSTFYGQGAGAAADAAAGSNTYIGNAAGAVNTDAFNTFVGWSAGAAAQAGNNTFVGVMAGRNVIGGRNTAFGTYAGMDMAGENNVFLGFAAGFTETGSHKLYIDNCALEAGGFCNRPLVYGEFDNRLLAVDGVMRVTANRTAALVKSQLHFSVTGADAGGWVTSAADNNFFISSGARYDAAAGGWIQRSPDGKAVMSGSGAAGFRVLTSSGGAVGSAVSPVDRLHIDYDGLMGVNTAPLAGRAINTSTGAYLSSGGVWTNASSREFKRNVHELSTEQAIKAFEELKPVTFEYNEGGRHVGFIAEDVPDLVATPDRKGLAAMDVVAVLTRVVQDKSRALEAQQRQMARMDERLRALEAALAAALLR